MKTGALVVAALIAGAFGAQWLLADAGYVLINVRGYLVEMSVPALLLILALLYFAIRLAVHLVMAPRRLGEAAGRFRARRAHEVFARGLLEMAEGNFTKGERLVTRGVRRSDTPVVNYLAAARAAQLRGAPERRDNWLRMAYEQSPHGTDAVLLTQAELQIADGQHEQALATLRQLEERSPNQPRGLALLAGLYAGLGDWDSLRDLLPRIAGRRAVDAATLEAWTIATHRHALESAPADGARIEGLWRSVPRAYQHSPALLRPYLEALARSGRTAAAEKTLRKALKREWDGSLALLYGDLETDDPAAQLQHAEEWLKIRGDDPDLLLAAARIAMRNELWGKARSYLESSLAIQPRAVAYQLYGRLLEKLGEAASAATAFRSGLALATDRDADSVPALTGPATGSSVASANGQS
ncbi:MAG TPA: heme biosynthesis HemY N-terminal domain-containing protein [Gammaproteobacteria bacterium]|nr:heme biosynthesis HemY N-terminal domain-containing protein [Gammaproteobacteria bacterium]